MHRCASTLELKPKFNNAKENLRKLERLWSSKQAVDEQIAALRARAEKALKREDYDTAERIFTRVLDQLSDMKGGAKTEEARWSVRESLCVTLTWKAKKAAEREELGEAGAGACACRWPLSGGRRACYGVSQPRRLSLCLRRV